MILLALINCILALSGAFVFFRLAYRRNRMRVVYAGACLYMLYVAAIYVHYFYTGQNVGLEYTRPATGVAIALMLAMGNYELIRY